MRTVDPDALGRFEYQDCVEFATQRTRARTRQVNPHVLVCLVFMMILMHVGGFDMLC